MDILVESGKIKVREKYFLTSTDIDKLISAKNFNEFISILEKSFYKIPSSITSGEIVNFFEKEREKLLEEIEKNISEEIFTIFTLKYDFHNLKLIAEGKEKKQLISLYSNVDYYSIKEVIEKRNYRKIPEHLKEAIKILVDEKVPVENKLLKLKNEYYKTLYNLILKLKSDFITEYGKIEIDFGNISTYIQKRQAGEKIEKIDFVKNGKIEIDFFENDEKLWKKVVSEYKNIKTPVDIKNFDTEKYKVIMEHIKRARIIPYGIEVIFSYYLAREIEIETLERITLGKFYNIETSFINKWKFLPYQYGG